MSFSGELCLGRCRSRPGRQERAQRAAPATVGVRKTGGWRKLGRKPLGATARIAPQPPPGHLVLESTPRRIDKRRRRKRRGTGAGVHGDSFGNGAAEAALATTCVSMRGFDRGILRILHTLKIDVEKWGERGKLRETLRRETAYFSTSAVLYDIESRRDRQTGWVATHALDWRGRGWLRIDLREVWPGLVCLSSSCLLESRLLLSTDPLHFVFRIVPLHARLPGLV